MVVITVVEVRKILFIALRRIYPSSGFRDSGIGKIAERVRSCTPREPMRVTSQEDPSLHVYTFSFLFAIYTGREYL